MCFRYIAARLPRFAENITSRNKEDISKGTHTLGNTKSVSLSQSQDRTRK